MGYSLKWDKPGRQLECVNWKINNIGTMTNNHSVINDNCLNMSLTYWANRRVRIVRIWVGGELVGGREGPFRLNECLLSASKV